MTEGAQPRRANAWDRIGGAVLFAAVLAASAGGSQCWALAERMPPGNEARLSYAIAVLCALIAVLLWLVLSFWQSRTSLRTAVLVFDGSIVFFLAILLSRVIQWFF